MAAKAAVNKGRPPDPPDQGNMSNSYIESSSKIKEPSYPAKEDFKELRQINKTKSKKTHNAGNFTRFLELNFKNKDRREINPYSVQKQLEEITGEKIINLTGANKSKLLVQSGSADQTKKLLKIKKIFEVECSVTVHPTFNTSKGLIRLKQFDIDDMEEFKDNLSEQYKIETIEKAPFIKSRYGETAYIITFHTEKLPYSIYVPGEITDTVVHSFKSRPMLCKSCQEYGHTAKRCRENESRCRNCSELGHNNLNCNNEPKCYHCGEDHPAGSTKCQKEISEQKLMDIIHDEKVTFQRAKQIMNPTPIIRQATSKPTPFATLFDVKLPPGAKRQLKNPWIIEKALKEHTGKTPRKCRGSPLNDDTFVIEVATLEESRKMSTLEKIGECEVSVQVNESQNNNHKGLIYIQGYDMMDFDGYKKDLIKDHNLSNVEHATWIKTKNSHTVALLVSFKAELPKYMDIPGESMKTVVYEYIRRPNHCKKCLNYGHSQRVCRDQQMCRNCTSTEHSQPSCNQPTQCLHCPQQHQTGDRKCQRYKVEEEVLAIQAKSLVSRQQAMIIYQREHPGPISTNYAAAVSSNIPSTSISSKSAEKQETTRISGKNGHRNDKKDTKEKSKGNSKSSPKSKLTPTTHSERNKDTKTISETSLQDQRQIPTLISNSRFNSLVDYADDDGEENGNQFKLNIPLPPAPPGPSVEAEDDRQSRSIRKRTTEDRSRSDSRHDKKGKTIEISGQINADPRKRRCP